MPVPGRAAAATTIAARDRPDCPRRHRPRRARALRCARAPVPRDACSAGRRVQRCRPGDRGSPHARRRPGRASLVDWTPIGSGRDLDGLARVSERGRAARRRRDRPPPRRPLRGRRAAPRCVRRIACRPLHAESARGVPCGVIKLGAGLPPADAVRGDRVRGRRRGARPDGRTGMRAYGARDDGPCARRAAAADSASRRPRSCSRTSIATPTRVSMPRPPRRARGSSSTVPAARSTGRTRRSCALIADLAERGLGGQHPARRGHRAALDAARLRRRAGIDYVFARFKPRLERELGSELADQIFVGNPARAFAFEP